MAIRKHITEQATVHPIGVLERDKKQFLVSVEPESHRTFLLPSKKESPFHFSHPKKYLVIGHTGRDTLATAHIRGMFSGAVSRKHLFTFLYQNGKTAKLSIGEHTQANQLTIKGSIPGIREAGGILTHPANKKAYVLYYGSSAISVSFSNDLKVWRKVSAPVLKSRPGFFDSGPISFLAAKTIEKGIIVFYSTLSVHDYGTTIAIGAALFSSLDPERMIWRSDGPLAEEAIPGTEGGYYLGSLTFGDTISFYWHHGRGHMTAISAPIPFSKAYARPRTELFVRSDANPIIAPQKGSWWSSQGTLNPAAIDIEGTVHLLFRAMGEDGISRIGHATSTDGIHIKYFSDMPVFHLQYPHIGKQAKEKRYDPVMYPSGGSWGGCEDPRMVRIGDRIYMTFNSFDSWDNMRVGITSILADNFLKGEWEWARPRLISPGRAKNWLVFPEKINGRYAILHSIYGKHQDHVRISYVKNLDTFTAKDMHMESADPQQMPSRRIAWHTHMRSATTPPIRTSEGWLVFYHAGDGHEPHRYKVGAMLLDLSDPEKVIARANNAVLVPDAWYENDWKPGIVYACGALVRGDTLFLYYGGGDKYVCVARAKFSEFLGRLKENRGMIATMQKVIIS